MENKEYEHEKQECWLDTANYCGFTPTDSAKRSAFNSAFDRAYALGKQEKDADTVIQGWVARDNGGFISLFLYRPDRVIHNDLGFWGHNDGSDEIDLPRSSFSDLTWDSDPLPVEIIIKRKNR